EVERRRIRRRLKDLERELEQVRNQREQQRASRRGSDLQTVAIVGYTNAGKSTLLNALTKAGVRAENKLFATLDPTTRRLRVPYGGESILTDLRAVGGLERTEYEEAGTRAWGWVPRQALARFERYRVGQVAR